MAQDPIQGLIDYVGEIKPYHTKILEVAVAYAHNDDVDITFTEDLQLDVSMFWPDVINSDDDSVPDRNCTAGYGILFDRQTPYIVIDASVSPQIISLDGDQTVAFNPGTRFEIREPIDVGSPILGSPLTQVIKYQTLSVDYDEDTNRTSLGAREIGSPLFSGSPPLSGTEFFFPPYSAGSISNGDVFIVYDVVETKVLRIVTRPSPHYGSPIIGSGSPFTPIWPDSAGSPLPGSPKIVTGSPATYPNFGSPIPSNTITIKSTTPTVFLYGQEVAIRNASEPTINRDYNILNAVVLPGSPTFVQLTVLDSVLADVVGSPFGKPIGELVFTPDGFSGGDLCGDVPPEILQTIWLENLDMTWRFEIGSPLSQPMVSAFQHFILSADSVNNTVAVQGDVRDIGSTFGSPVGGSPLSIPATIQHARTAFGSPYFDFILVDPARPKYHPAPGFGSPHVNNLSSNNSDVIISNITYDVTTNISTITLDIISISTPSGWIISRQ